jgi:hypothetical protein
MNIRDRSVIERLSHPCLQDNTEIEVRIYRQLFEEEGSWSYVPPGLELGEGDRYRAEIMIRNIGREIDFDDVAICVTIYEKEGLQGAIALYEDHTFETETDVVDLALGLLRSADGTAEIVESRKSAPIAFATNRRIDKEDRKKLFAYRVQATIVPRAHYEQSMSPQHDFPRPIISVQNIDFAKVNTGETSEPRRLTIENAGRANLFVGRIASPSSDAFSLDLAEAPEIDLPEDLEMELPEPHLAVVRPGESAVLGMVTFAPIEEEKYLDTIKIHSNDPTCRVNGVQLSGEGAHWFRAIPDYLNFGDVHILENEQGVDRYFTLKNEHPSRVCEASIGPELHPDTDAGITFSFSACTWGAPCTLRPKTSREVRVTALPKAGGREGEHVVELGIAVSGETRRFYVTLRANAVMRP